MHEPAFRARLAEQGYDGPELVERTANTHNPEHAHDFDVALLVLDGELCVSTAAGITTCRAGDTFELAGGIPHTEQYGPHGARVLVGRRAARPT
ncbi:MAG: cupin [Gammaproteobacteria bacterium]